MNSNAFHALDSVLDEDNVPTVYEKMTEFCLGRMKADDEMAMIVKVCDWRSGKTIGRKRDPCSISHKNGILITSNTTTSCLCLPVCQ